MRKSPLCLALCGVMLLCATAFGQPPRRGDGERGNQAAGDLNSFLSRLLAYDENQDNALSIDEVTDARLKPMLNRADNNQDGKVTRQELTAFYEKESSALGQSRGGFGGPPGGGPGGGPGGMGGPPMPGQVLPPFLQEVLQLSAEQRNELGELQKDVDARLAKILTEQQRRQLQQMRERAQGAGGPPFGGEAGNRNGRRPTNTPPRNNQNRRPQ